MAIFTTSNGSRTIRSPFSENMTRIVKSKATNVRGLVHSAAIQTIVMPCSQ
jgi:hypothetical protein